MYSLEGGADGLAYMRLESLLKLVMGVLDNHEVNSGRFGKEGVSMRLCCERNSSKKKLAYAKSWLLSQAI